jgi:DeoR/GlpR family transcriptional regulator of sugar metabolism
MNEKETDILKLIQTYEDVTYNDLVNISSYSPQTIDRALRALKKARLIETYDLKDKKARGWRIA